MQRPRGQILFWQSAGSQEPLNLSCGNSKKPGTLKKDTLQLGFFAAIATAVVTTGTFVIAFLTPPLSGPFCEGPCFEYPYSDITARFPRDYFWMYPAMAVSLLSLALVICIHHYARSEKKIFSHLGVSLASMSAAILIADYFLQVSVIQPALLNGETDGIALWSQFNPHGLFIALEEIGYLLMNLALLSIAPVFSGKSGMDRAIRFVFVTAAILAFSALVAVSATYGILREYIFEVIIISIVWLELIISSALLARVFGKMIRAPRRPAAKK